MRVAVIEAEGQVLCRGEWDGKRVEGVFARVQRDGDKPELYNLAYVYKEEHTDTVSTQLKESAASVKAAKDAHMKTIYTLANAFGAR